MNARKYQLVAQDANLIQLRSTPDVVDLIPEMIPIKEVASRTGLSYDFIRKSCLRGDIVHIRCGSKFLINFGRLVEWLNTSRGGDSL